jgi:type IV pilus assembly protein PilZ
VPELKARLLELLARGSRLTLAEVTNAVPKDVPLAGRSVCFSAGDGTYWRKRRRARSLLSPSERAIAAVARERTGAPAGWLALLTDAQATAASLNAKLAVESALIGPWTPRVRCVKTRTRPDERRSSEGSTNGQAAEPVRPYCRCRSRKRRRFTPPHAVPENGGIFVRQHGPPVDDVYRLTLLDDATRIPVAGKVVWVSPGRRQQDTEIGVHFPADESGGRRASADRGRAGRSLKSARPTHTL